MRQQAEANICSEKDFAALTQDRQWRQVNRTMRLNNNQPEALIETLHAVQDTFGFLDHQAMAYVAHVLRVPLSRVYAVATFYHYFSLKPPGEHSCVVCMGTACYIGGSSALLDQIQQSAAIGPGETSKDGKVSLVVARCLGSCGLAPAAVFDGRVAGKLNPALMEEQLERWLSHDPEA
ncbi:bidirectional hydrogenase complex protein HoxE [Desulfogranum mediterraneum]|uniref:bidirectional hydrogenase complex protein HoxE n=1 Tax=Desulfogranum mediterraneum TaxID=160661 RepID=UPI000429B330|nr:bidirectional hydrogenase complex protein HoxE [Desulfogranum mediterraneum]